ncbi:hypothetical protein Tco_0597240 [Tanacetum coccineum]
MCLNSWGHNTYAQALLRYLLHQILDSLIMVVSFQNGPGHSLVTINIEYEWKPPRCDTCKIFDHTDEHCPKKPKTTTPTLVTDDGFVESTASDSDSEEVKKVFVEDNGKSIDGLVDDAWKKVEASPRRLLGKLVFGRV